jgi:hypothetical protein
VDFLLPSGRQESVPIPRLQPRGLAEGKQSLSGVHKTFERSCLTRFEIPKSFKLFEYCSYEVDLERRHCPPSVAGLGWRLLS